MSGPYFYAVYSHRAKALQQSDPQAFASRIALAGYASIALLGPTMGRLADKKGRRWGTLAAAALYGMGGASTLIDATAIRAAPAVVRSTYAGIAILVLGRASGGLGSSLLSAAPEAWMVHEFQVQQKKQPRPLPAAKARAAAATFIRETLGRAYTYDPMVAIAAGQIATWAASRQGPTGPFMVSPMFLLLGGFIVATSWDESIEGEGGNKKQRSPKPIPQKQPSMRDNLSILRSDKKILLFGIAQVLFDATLEIFIMVWPPSMTRAIHQTYGDDAVTPYGVIFSCFMACCMVGGSIFASTNAATDSSGKRKSLERSTVILMGVSCLSFVMAIFATSQSSSTTDDTSPPKYQEVAAWQSLAPLIVSYFVYESCVGLYFPSIGTLRSKYLPDTHRSSLMSLFGVPQNAIVVSVFLSVHKLGNSGALAMASAGLLCATACMMALCSLDTKEAKRCENLAMFDDVVATKIMHTSKLRQGMQRGRSVTNVQEPKPEGRRESLQLLKKKRLFQTSPAVLPTAEINSKIVPTGFVEYGAPKMRESVQDNMMVFDLMEDFKED
ncbi:hypothetical protein ACHAWF_015979 [Thalassiosira exigua]